MGIRFNDHHANFGRHSLVCYATLWSISWGDNLTAFRKCPPFLLLVCPAAFHSAAATLAVLASCQEVFHPKQTSRKVSSRYSRGHVVQNTYRSNGICSLAAKKTSSIMWTSAERMEYRCWCWFSRVEASELEVQECRRSGRVLRASRLCGCPRSTNRSQEPGKKFFWFMGWFFFDHLLRGSTVFWCV